MVTIRFRRIGKKFNPFYQIVVADSRAPRDGRFIEKIGHYNPHSKELVINQELKDKWLKEGARLSPTVKTLFKKDGAKIQKASATKKVTKQSSKKTLTNDQVES